MTPNTKIQNRGKAEQRKIPRNPKRRDDGKSPNIPKEGTVNNVKQSCPKKLMLRARDLRKISSLLTPPPSPQKGLTDNLKKNSDVKLIFPFCVFFPHENKFREIIYVEFSLLGFRGIFRHSVLQDFWGFSVIPPFRILGDFLSFRLLGFGVNLSRSMTPPFRRSTVLSFRLLGSPPSFFLHFL